MNGDKSWADFIDGLLKDCEDRQATADLRGAQGEGELGGDMTIAALPTIYRGTQFRSLLEACWAATLDSLNITWEYEPTIFDLPSGAKYLPDFHLPEIGTWIEVKGPGVPRIEKAYELGKMLGCDCRDFACTCETAGGEMVIIGHPPTPLDVWNGDAYRHWPRRAKAKLARRHGGFIRWTSTRRYNSWMTRCAACSRVTWVEGPRLHRCPACGVAPISDLFRDFERQYEFVRLPWLSGSAIRPDGDPDGELNEEDAA